MRKITGLVLGGSLLSVLICASVWAQATAGISGTARDQSGAVLPGVEIAVTQTDTGITRNTITNETGSFVLPNLVTGPYRLEAALPGFRTYVQTGIVLQVNSTPVINVTLEVGQVSENVAVQANASLVETRSSALGSVIENARILELPLNGRTVTDLITLAGGAVQQSTTSANYGGGGTPLLAVAGGSAWGVDYTLDGASHMDFMSGTTLLMPFPDATQEFKVETSGTTAQHGGSTAVAAVTKSGTNEFHGDLFEFVRNDLFNARSYFATKHSTLKRNQFGGTIGGPIVRNRLFFFGGYQGTTLRSDPADSEAFVPTPAMLAGDWTAITSPACNNGRQVNLSAPFVNNRIDPALFSKPALFVVNWKKMPLPFPTPNNPCGSVRYGNLDKTNLGSYVGKVDYQQSAKHSLMGRAVIFTNEKPNPSGFNTSLLQSTGYSSSIQHSYILGSTYLIDANTVQAFRLAVNRSAIHFRNVGPSELFNYCDAGVKIYCEPRITRMNGLAVTGGFTVDGSFVTGQQYTSTAYNVSDDVSLLRGTHQISVGASATHGREVSLSTFFSATRMSFAGSATGLGLADFMLGKPSQIILAKSNPHHVKGTTVNAYVADTWKVNQKLTLSYGVRWEPFLPQQAEFMFNFDYDRFQKGMKSTVFLNAPAGLAYRGDPGLPKTGINSRLLQFAPRMGLAWDVSGDGRTSVRASYGYSYMFIPGNYRLIASTEAPWGGYTILLSPPGGMENPWQGIPGGNIFPYDIDKNSPFGPAGLFYSQPTDLRTPVSNSWNVGIQRQVGNNWLVSGSYMGSNIIHAWANKALNPATYFPGGPCTLDGVTYNPCSKLGNTDARRRFSLERPQDGAKYGYVSEADDGATQYYHGMLVSLERRAARGVTVTANYTLSHCISDYANAYNPQQDHPNNTYTNPNNRKADRGNCESDRRNIFNLTTVAETPQFSNPKLRMLATGWRVSGIYRRSAGNPLNILASSDRALNGLGNHRANQVLASPFGNKSASPLSSYLSSTAFADPALGTVGNVGRNSLTGPGTWAFDMALSRMFRFGEVRRIEFRAEAYNVTNSFRPGNPNTTVGNRNFGQIRTSSDPRILQFALKYVF